MNIVFTVTLAKIIEEFNLEILYCPVDPQEITVSTADINRPGLQFSGFFDYFDSKRLQIIGRSELAFLEQFDEEKILTAMEAFFATQPPAVIITRSLPPFPQMMAAAQKFEVPILAAADSTSAFSSALNSFLNVELAPRVTRHGVLVEVYGEGVLLLGDSGVGKSETAVELIKRGHRLIADDAVEIRRVSGKTLVGSSPENIRHFLELRGIGIINARRIFGMGSVKMTEKIDMVIQMEHWDQNKIYDRMGIDNNYMEILGLQITSYTIPVKPGRNLAIIIEIAAMNNRQKKMGYNAAQELLDKLGIAEDSQSASNWDSY